MQPYSPRPRKWQTPGTTRDSSVTAPISAEVLRAATRRREHCRFLAERRQERLVTAADPRAGRLRAFWSPDADCKVTVRGRAETADRRHGSKVVSPARAHGRRARGRHMRSFVR